MDRGDSRGGGAGGDGPRLRPAAMVILGRGRSRPDGHDLSIARAANGMRPGDARMSRGACRVVGSFVGAAAQGAGPRPALLIGLGSLARTPERAAVRSSTRGPDGSPE